MSLDESVKDREEIAVVPSPIDQKPPSLHEYLRMYLQKQAGDQPLAPMACYDVVAQLARQSIGSLPVRLAYRMFGGRDYHRTISINHFAIHDGLFGASSLDKDPLVAIMRNSIRHHKYRPFASSFDALYRSIHAYFTKHNILEN